MQVEKRMFGLLVLAQWEMQCRAGRLLPNIETTLLNLPNMKSVIISLNIQDENGRYIPLEELDVKQLKNVRFRLLVEAGKIKQAIFNRTGEILDD